MREDEIPVFPGPVDESGCVAIGGELSPNWFLGAYLQGVFPWPIIEGDVEQLAWFSPNPRAILPLDGLRTSKRLARKMRSGQFRFTINQHFDEVLENCSKPRGEGGVWLSESMKAAYRDLHRLGNSHSFEAHVNGELAGGLLGVSLRGLFSAESMFHFASDAGNATVTYLVRQLNACGYELLDIQQASDHMTRRGAIEIAREEYLARLQKAMQRTPAPWDATAVDEG